MNQWVTTALLPGEIVAAEKSKLVMIYYGVAKVNKELATEFGVRDAISKAGLLARRC